ncbi:MAG: SdrD B-like domain-containing protein [Ferruginibacter sp.]
MGSCDFDPSPLTESIDIGTAPNAAFIAQYDHDGNFLNVMPVYGTNSYIFNHGVVKDNNENLYFTGGFQGTADFDPTAVTNNLTATGTYQDIYMSRYKIGSARISGRLWNDANSNGIPDPNELTGLSNVKVELIYDRNNNNTFDPYDGIISNISQADGTYTFDFIAEGNYLLRVLPQPGYTSTTTLIENADVSIGQIISNKNFGFVSSLVPVICSDFSANQFNDEIKVQWKTYTEVNTRGFNLQRSLDGISFENIAWINAQGNSTGTFNYLYSDKGTSGISDVNNYYYRLQEIDISGNGKYICNILMVKYKAQKSQVIIYPNPVNENLHLLLTGEYDQLLITDLAGRKIKRLSIDTNTRAINVSVKALTPGIYFIKLAGKNGNKQSAKMIKL